LLGYINLRETKWVTESPCSNADQKKTCEVLSVG